MFRQKTTIIVGAGASCELGLPSGDALKTQILQFLKAGENAYGFADEAMVALLKQRCGADVWNHGDKLSPIKSAAARIRKGLPLALSIDNFLHSHQGDKEVEHLGKLAIAINIARAESHSCLFARQPAMRRARSPDQKPILSIDNETILKSWYPVFAQLVLSGVHRDNISEAFANLRFVIFNYDRCLEQYLCLALQAYFDINLHQAAEVLSSVQFIHPYGDLGPLPWQGRIGSVEFGAANLPAISEMPDRIRTFTESVESQTGDQVREAVNWAKTLLILGFGYLDQNVKLLSRSTKSIGNRVFSTAYGVSEQDQIIMGDVMQALASAERTNVRIEPGSCRDLFDHFRLHLSLR